MPSKKKATNKTVTKETGAEGSGQSAAQMIKTLQSARKAKQKTGQGDDQIQCKIEDFKVTSKGNLIIKLSTSAIDEYILKLNKFRGHDWVNLSSPQIPLFGDKTPKSSGSMTGTHGTAENT